MIPVLSYGRPDTKVPFLLHAGLAPVALMDVLGGFGLIMAGVTGLAAPASFLNFWMLLFGMLLFTPGVMVWSRTVYAWRRSLALFYANGFLLTLVSFAAALRLWHSIGTVPADSIFFNLFFGGAWGTLNWCGAYVLCRSKRAVSCRPCRYRLVRAAGPGVSNTARPACDGICDSCEVLSVMHDINHIFTLLRDRHFVRSFSFAETN